MQMRYKLLYGPPISQVPFLLLQDLRTLSRGSADGRACLARILPVVFADGLRRATIRWQGFWRKSRLRWQIANRTGRRAAARPSLSGGIVATAHIGSWGQ